MNVTMDSESQVMEIVVPGPRELVFQAMAVDPLETCPVCSKPVEKIFSAVAGKVNKLATSNIKNQGFTRWVRRDKGVYEKDT